MSPLDAELDLLADDAFVFALLGLRSLARGAERLVLAAVLPSPTVSAPARPESSRSSAMPYAFLGALSLARGVAALVEATAGPRSAPTTAAGPAQATTPFVPRRVAR